MMHCIISALSKQIQKISLLPVISGRQKSTVGNKQIPTSPWSLGILKDVP